MSDKLQSLARESSTTLAHGPLDSVLEALGRIQYGAIQLTVHDGRLVQVDITERRRFR